MDDLSPDPAPETYDLCEPHADRTTPPSGWRLIDKRRGRGAASIGVDDLGRDEMIAVLSAALRAEAEPGGDGADSDERPATLPPGPSAPRARAAAPSSDTSDAVDDADDAEDAAVGRPPLALRPEAPPGAPGDALQLPLDGDEALTAIPEPAHLFDGRI